MNIVENTSLKKFNTFGIDVNSRYFAEIVSEEELIDLLTSKNIKPLSKLILGGGSNILFTKDFNGIVISINIPGIKIKNESNEYVMIEAGAGVQWHQLVQYSVENNFGGIENLALIPGTVGAAPMQNIGAYGQEVKDSFHSLKGIFIDTCMEKTFYKDECEFGYRESIFKHELKEKFIITKVVLKLLKNPHVNISYNAVAKELETLKINNPGVKDVFNAVCNIRRSKLPDPSVLGNAGSFFKNPVVSNEEFLRLKNKFPEIVSFPAENEKVKLAAGWLIEKCGWKGKRMGNSGSHQKQSLVLVNYGGATGGEVLKLAGEIKKSVREMFGVNISEEVNIY